MLRNKEIAMTIWMFQLYYKIKIVYPIRKWKYSNQKEEYSNYKEAERQEEKKMNETLGQKSGVHKIDFQRINIYFFRAGERIRDLV